MNEKIRDLQKQIESEEKKISNCDHNWGKSFSNPDTKLEPYGLKTVGRGSDVWTEAEGYRDVEVPRWTRVCTICEHEDHAYKQKPIIINKGLEPDFD